MSERRVFRRYLIRYLTIVMIVVLCCIPFGVSVYGYVKDDTISKSITSMKEDVVELDSQFEKMHMIVNMMSANAYMQSLQGLRGEIPTNRYLYMKYLQETLSEVHLIYDFSKFSFLVFRNTPIFVSAGQVSDDYYEYYGHFLSAGDLTAEELRSMILKTGPDKSFFPVNDFRYYKDMKKTMDRGFLYIESTKDIADIGGINGYQVFVIEEDMVVDMLVPESDRNNMVLLVQDKDDQTLVSYGLGTETPESIAALKEGEARIGDKSYWVMHFDNLQCGLMVTIGYSMSSIYQQLGNVIKILVFYIVLGCAVALILTILFTRRWFRPFRKVLYEVNSLKDMSVQGDNVYDYIRESLLKMVSHNDETEAKMLLVEAQKQAIMLENIFIRGFSGRAEMEDFRESFPAADWKKGYYVVLFFIQHTDSEQERKAILYAVELLKQHRGFFNLFVCPEDNAAMILISEVAETKAVTEQEEYLLNDNLREEDICGLFVGISEMTMKDYDVKVVVGISRKHTELGDINVAGAQARQTVSAYRNQGKSVVELYQTMYTAEKNCFHISMLRGLYDMVLCADREAIRKTFEEMKEEVLRNPGKYEFQKQDICSSIRFVLQSVSQQMELPMEMSVDVRNYDFARSLDILEESVFSMCDQIEGKKADRSEELRMRLLEYMEENFNRAELTANLVGRELKISEKYIYVLIKEKTGTTFSGYLEELRLAFARRCLEQTDWSNEKIAEEAGFGSVNSFYRIFKKKTGLSPNVYRKGKVLSQDSE